MRRCPVKIQSAITDIQIPKDAQAGQLGICFIISTELVRKKKKQINKQISSVWMGSKSMSVNIYMSV